MSDHRIMMCYKTSRCNTCPPGRPKPECKRWHTAADRRRPIEFDRFTGTFNYIPLMCENAATCRNKSCHLSHNQFEQMFHPSRFKTVTCENASTRRCSHPFCSFAHSKNDLRYPRFSTDRRYDSSEGLDTAHVASYSWGEFKYHYSGLGYKIPDIKKMWERSKPTEFRKCPVRSRWYTVDGFRKKFPNDWEEKWAASPVLPGREAKQPATSMRPKSMPPKRQKPSPLKAPSKSRPTSTLTTSDTLSTTPLRELKLFGLKPPPLHRQRSRTPPPKMPSSDSKSAASWGGRRWSLLGTSSTSGLLAGHGLRSTQELRTPFNMGSGFSIRPIQIISDDDSATVGSRDTVRASDTGSEGNRSAIKPPDSRGTATGSVDDLLRGLPEAVRSDFSKFTLDDLLELSSDDCKDMCRMLKEPTSGIILYNRIKRAKKSLGNKN